MFCCSLVVEWKHRKVKQLGLVVSSLQWRYKNSDILWFKHTTTKNTNTQSTEIIYLNLLVEYYFWHPLIIFNVSKCTFFVLTL